MSARSKRSTSSHTSTSTTSRQSTHQLNETSEVTSPMTPGKKSRDEEKAHLQNLNDRLATYIDRVRFLEGENSKLTSQIVTIEEKTSREISTQKNLYDTELAEARRVLDETAQEKARLQIEATSRKSELEELKQRLLRKEREVEGLDARLLGLEATNNDLRSRLSQANSEKKKLEDQLKESNREVDKLSRQLESAKKQLEQETLARVGVENKLLTLSDKLKFMEECHDKEISETKRIAHMEKTDIDHRLKDHYEQQMKDNLRELRENHEEQLRISRKEIEEKYQDLQDELQRKLDLLMSSTNSTTEEMHTYKTRADNIASQMDDLKAQLESMKNRKKDLEKMLEQEREWHRNALRNKDNEIRQLTEQLNRQLKEFHDVLDTNVGINSELAVYEKLLEAEECRLNLSKEDSLSGTTPTRRGAPSRKRKRVVQMEEEESQKEQSSSGGLLEIVDQDPQGSYIKIHNRSSQEMPLGGYVLVRESGEDNSCRYKFTRHVNIKPKSDITVWGHSSGKTHNPAAGDLVMKVGMNWPTGDVVTTALLNPAGEEMAARSMSKRSHTSRQDSSSHDLRLVEDDQANGDAMQERCSVM